MQQIKETAMINSTDPRYDRTESDLLDAFKILAGQKALNKISVSEITKLTGVTRTHFTTTMKTCLLSSMPWKTASSMKYFRS